MQHLGHHPVDIPKKSLSIGDADGGDGGSHRLACRIVVFDGLPQKTQLPMGVPLCRRQPPVYTTIVEVTEALSVHHTRRVADTRIRMARSAVRFPLHHGLYTAHGDVSRGETGGLYGGVCDI